jgi:hypothetical protein
MVGFTLLESFIRRCPAANPANEHESETFRRRFTQMNADGSGELSFLEKRYTAKDAKRRKGNAARTLNSNRGQKFEAVVEARSLKPPERSAKQRGQAVLRRVAVRRVVLGRPFSETTVSTTPPGTTRLIRRLVEVAAPPRVSGDSPNKAFI